MTRRTTVNRIHRTARSKEPKTIQDALPLLQQLMRDGESLWVEGNWYHSTDHGRASSSVEYSCFAFVYLSPASSDASCKVRAKADSPAKLVRAFVAELQKPRSRELVVTSSVAQPAPPPAAARPAAPRLNQHRPLLTAGGGS